MRSWSKWVIFSRRWWSWSSTGPRRPAFSEWSVSRRTAFERASSTPDQLARIEYDSLDRLVAAGIVPAPQPLPLDRPSPFPGSPMAFVPDPPRW